MFIYTIRRYLILTVIRRRYNYFVRTDVLMNNILSHVREHYSTSKITWQRKTQCIIILPITEVSTDDRQVNSL